MAIGVLRVKSGVSFSVIAPGGFRILSALDQCAARLSIDLVLTSACDGPHSGPADPHHKGEAYDVRSHDLSADEKHVILRTARGILGDAFFGFLESEGSPSEHFHFQVRKGAVYPPVVATND